jgi:hypothetical protein
MTRKEELLKEIAQLETVEKEFKSLVEYAKVELEGKCFSKPHSSKLYGVNALHYVHYSNVRVDERGNIMVDVREANLFWTKSKSKHSESSLRCQRTYESIRDRNQIYDLTTSRGTAISLEVFESKWNYTNAKIEATVKAAIAVDFPTGNIPAYDDRDVREGKQGDLDIPFIVLPNSVNHLLTSSVFHTGGKYMMTPGSKQYVANLIEKKLNERARMSCHFEECDRRYLEMEMEQIYELRRIFGL